MISCLNCIKMNETLNKFLLAGDTFMPEMQMHLKQPWFTYSDFGQKFKETRNAKYIYRKKWVR